MSDEYTRIKPRQTDVRVPIVGQDVTARLLAPMSVLASGTVAATGSAVTSYFQQGTTVIQAVNTGNTAITFSVQETSDQDQAAPRTVLAGPVALVPGGMQMMTTVSTQRYLEIVGSGNVTQEGEVQLQLESDIRWSQVGQKSNMEVQPDPMFPAVLTERLDDSPFPGASAPGAG